MKAAPGRPDSAARKVRAARAGSDQYYPRSTGHATDAASKEGGILFVSADDGLDFGIQESVENLVDLCSGNSKNVLDSLSLQTLY
jgi:hypothetical protein